MSRRWLAALFVASALLLAACGDDGGSSSENPAEQGSDGGGDVDQAAGDGDDGPQSDLDGYFSGDCQEAVAAFNSALVSAGSPLAGAGTPDDAVDSLDAVAEAAPDEIKDDFAVLTDAYGEFAQALADAGIDFEDPSSFSTPEAIAALQSLEDTFDEDELDQASNEIEAWFDANCG